MRDIRFEAAGVLGSGVVAALLATTRLVRVGAEHYERFRSDGTPVVFAFWHGHLLPLVHYHRHENIVVLVSEHEDGEYITRIIRRQGFRTVRGSSTRGHTKGLKGLLREARLGRDVALTPDGPQGPRGVFKAGALMVARATGHPVIPISVRSSSGWRLRSWDAFLVPRPFATVTIEYFPPIFVPRDAGREELGAIAAEIETLLHEAPHGAPA